MKHLIIGQGEVGKALKAIIPDASVCDPKYEQYPENTPFDVLHICFPFSHRKVATGGNTNDERQPNDADWGFIENVKQYKRMYSPSLVIIHSSVPIGTSDELDAVHSPVRGVHPFLEKGIRTFVKFFGGFKAKEAAEIFDELGIKTRWVRDARTAEALKLWDTTQYGNMILLEKEIHEFCKKNGVDFEIVYAEANQTYNDGYVELGMAHVVRPLLMHKTGPIGGHCVVENSALFDSETPKRIIAANEVLKPKDVPPPSVSKIDFDEAPSFAEECIEEPPRFHSKKKKGGY